MVRTKYHKGEILSTKLGKTFTITNIVEVDHGSEMKLYYVLENHGHRQLPISYIDSSEHLTCINRTKAGKLLWSK